jgi:hypothetical protein
VRQKWQLEAWNEAEKYTRGKFKKFEVLKILEDVIAPYKHNGPT